MFEYTDRLIPRFNWLGLVQATISKRKEAGLTQKKHAALSGVSIPTMISFERGETTLSIAKVIDILDVVGMLEKHKELDSIEEFASESYNRWKYLTGRKSTDDSPAKHPLGYIAYAFKFNGNLKKLDDSSFYKLLQETSKTKYSGYTPFWIPTSQEIKPYYTDENTVECWLGNEKHFSVIETSSYNTGFWRASKSGLCYLQRGYKDDEEPLNAGIVLDLTRPIREAAEVIAYSIRFAKLIAANSDEPFSLRFYTLYTGLQGRNLANVSDASRPFFEKKISKSGTAILSILISSEEINGPLNESISKLVFKLLKDLYFKFNFELQYEQVEQILLTYLAF